MNSDAFTYRRGKLHAEGVSIESLVRRLGTPLYVYSQSAFERGLRTIQGGLSSLESFTVCYALKANSNLAIVKMMGDLGAGADLVSGGELERARMAGIPPDRVVFSGVGKTAEEIAAGLAYGGRGITSFHVESLEELGLIDRVVTKEISFKDRAVIQRVVPLK